MTIVVGVRKAARVSGLRFDETEDALAPECNRRGDRCDTAGTAVLLCQSGLANNDDTVTAASTSVEPGGEAVARLGWLNGMA